MAKYVHKTKQTRAAIMTTMMKLLENQKLDSITVRDIIEDAKISRGTFYRYFLDKYEIVEQAETDILTELTLFHNQAIPDNVNWQEHNSMNTQFLLEMLNYVNEHAQMMRLLLGKNVDLPFQEMLTQNLADAVRSGIIQLFQMHQGIEAEMFVQYIAAAVLGVIKYWLFEKPEMTVEEVYRFVAEISQNHIKQWGDK